MSSWSGDEHLSKQTCVRDVVVKAWHVFTCPNIHSNIPIIGVLEWILGHMNTCPFGQENSLRPWTINFEIISMYFTMARAVFSCFFPRMREVWCLIQRPGSRWGLGRLGPRAQKFDSRVFKSQLAGVCVETWSYCWQSQGWQKATWRDSGLIIST